MRVATLVQSGPQLPMRDLVVMTAVMISGLAAASLAEPLLWYLTPAVVVCLLLASREGALRAAGSDMPEELNEKLATTLNSLPTGEIRALYNDVIEAAAPVFSRRMRRLSDHYARHTRDSVIELLEAASHVAIDASRLDMTLRSGTMLHREQSVRISAEKARAQYAKQLADVVATLNALVASGLAHGTPESDRVTELVAEIRDETTARTEAWKEIDSLLA
jgi:hypothetical protein